MVSITANELPAGTGAIKVTVQRLNGTGTVWVDDVRCEEGVSRKEDKTYYYHCDYLGSPRVMTDYLGNVIWRQDYLAFGGDYNTTATGNTHKFTGHVKDDATGQYYAKARYFTTSLGRFSQPDPILKGVPQKRFLVNPQKLNPYVYCLNNPLLYVDPFGLENTIYALKTEEMDEKQWETAKETVLDAFSDAGLTDMQIVEVASADKLPMDLDATDCRLTVGPVAKETNPSTRKDAAKKDNIGKSGLSVVGSKDAHVFTDRIDGGSNSSEKGTLLGNIMGHEVGHGLGLDGHNKNATSTDIMKAQFNTTRPDAFQQKYFNKSDASYLQKLN